MLEIKIQTSHRRYVAPADLVRVLGAARALEELGDMVEALITQIDILAGDPDLEESDAEDSFAPSVGAVERAEGPGCSISEPDHGIEDRGQDEPDGEPLAVLSWGEDQTLPLPFDPDADRRIFCTHRDFIRARYYTPAPPVWRGDPPTYVRKPPIGSATLVPVSPAPLSSSLSLITGRTD